MIRLWRFSLWFAILAAALWVGGFLSFVHNIENLAEPGTGPGLEKTDAIVVLTGGSDRLTTGLELLSAGAGQKLFISGVHKGLSLDAMLGTHPVSPELRTCCIVLGHRAISTTGNAVETRQWMDAEKNRSLRLVTANYHMPRSLLLFEAEMPDITLIAHPVIPDGLELADWWRHAHTTELLANEYSKFLFAKMRLFLIQKMHFNLLPEPVSLE